MYCCNIDSIVFLSWLPMSQREASLFSFDYLKKEGFRVEIIDLSLLLCDEKIMSESGANKLEGDYIHKISSYEELENILSRYQPQSIFIDWVMGHSNILPSHEKVYRILRRINIRYFVIVIGGMPLWNTAGGPQSKVQIIKGKINRAISMGFSGLLQYCGQQAIKWLRQNGCLYPLPVRVFGTACEELHDFVQRYRISFDQVLYLNYVDYDKYVSYRKAAEVLMNKSSSQQKGTCVFLDDAQTHHVDFELLKIPPITATDYYSSMRRFFDTIETETGLEVIVAVHPRSRYEEIPGVFGDRQIVKNKTLELVAESSMAIAHSSSSINFALMFDKPLLFVTTKGLSETGRNIWIEPLARELALPFINIDDCQAANFDVSQYKTWSRDRYANYISKYIRSRDSDELTMMEVIVAEIRKMERGEHGGSI